MGDHTPRSAIERRRYTGPRRLGLVIQGPLKRGDVYVHGLQRIGINWLATADLVTYAQTDGSGTTHRYCFVILPVVRIELRPRVS